MAMTDEQRRAMFARMKYGGGGGASSGKGVGRSFGEEGEAIEEYQRQVNSNLAKTPGVAGEFFHGMWEGANEGADNAVNAITFGASDASGITRSYENEGRADAISKWLAQAGAALMYAAIGGQLGTVAGMAAEEAVGATSGAGIITRWLVNDPQKRFMNWLKEIDPFMERGRSSTI